MKRGKPPEGVTHAEVEYHIMYASWYFKIHLNGKKYADFVSAMYKTKKEAQNKLSIYLRSGIFD